MFGLIREMVVEQFSVFFKLFFKSKDIFSKLWRNGAQFKYWLFHNQLSNKITKKKREIALNEIWFFCYLQNSSRLCSSVINVEVFVLLNFLLVLSYIYKNLYKYRKRWKKNASFLCEAIQCCIQQSLRISQKLFEQLHKTVSVNL